jgi:hypothetical protein
LAPIVTVPPSIAKLTGSPLRACKLATADFASRIATRLK